MLYGAPLAPGDVPARRAQGPACRLTSPLDDHDLGGQITDLDDRLHLRFGLLLSPGGGAGREPITGCALCLQSRREAGELPRRGLAGWLGGGCAQAGVRAAHTLRACRELRSFSLRNSSNRAASFSRNFSARSSSASSLAASLSSRWISFRFISRAY